MTGELSEAVGYLHRYTVDVFGIRNPVCQLATHSNPRQNAGARGRTASAF